MSPIALLLLALGVGGGIWAAASGKLTEWFKPAQPPAPAPNPNPNPGPTPPGPGQGQNQNPGNGAGTPGGNTGSNPNILRPIVTADGNDDRITIASLSDTNPEHYRRISLDWAGNFIPVGDNRTEASALLVRIVDNQAYIERITTATVKNAAGAVSGWTNWQQTSLGANNSFTINNDGTVSASQADAMRRQRVAPAIQRIRTDARRAAEAAAAARATQPATVTTQTAPTGANGTGSAGGSAPSIPASPQSQGNCSDTVTINRQQYTITNMRFFQKPERERDRPDQWHCMVTMRCPDGQLRTCLMDGRFCPDNTAGDSFRIVNVHAIGFSEDRLTDLSGFRNRFLPVTRNGDNMQLDRDGQAYISIGPGFYKHTIQDVLQDVFSDCNNGQRIRNLQRMPLLPAGTTIGLRSFDSDNISPEQPIQTTFLQDTPGPEGAQITPAIARNTPAGRAANGNAPAVS